MLSFDNLDYMWGSLLRELHPTRAKLHKSRAGATTEVVGWSARLTDITANVVTNPVRKLATNYGAAEFLWYLSGDKSVDLLLPHAPGYKRFADEAGEANGAYGDRWKNNPGFKAKTEQSPFHSQLQAVYHLLSRKPETRHAVVTMWDSGDLADAAMEVGHKDVPCTCTLQFHVRDEKLHLSTHMRSNDAWLGFCYDVYCFSNLQRLMADALDLGYGDYVHMVGSMHLYEKNWEDAKVALTRVPGYRHPGRCVGEKMHPAHAQHVVQCYGGWPVGIIRELTIASTQTDVAIIKGIIDAPRSWMTDVVLTAAHKLNPIACPTQSILNPDLANGLKAK